MRRGRSTRSTIHWGVEGTVANITIVEAANIQAKDRASEGKGYMARIKRIAAYEVNDPPLLNNTWKGKPLTTSDGSATREGSRASEPDLDGDPDASAASEILKGKLVSMDLIRDFKFQPDEIIGASIDDPEPRRRMRLQRVQEYRDLKADLLKEVEELEEKITEDRESLAEQYGEQVLEKQLPTRAIWETIDEDT